MAGLGWAARSARSGQGHGTHSPSPSALGAIYQPPTMNISTQPKPACSQPSTPQLTVSQLPPEPDALKNPAESDALRTARLWSEGGVASAAAVEAKTSDVLANRQSWDFIVQERIAKGWRGEVNDLKPGTNSGQGPVDAPACGALARSLGPLTPFSGLHAAGHGSALSGLSAR